MQLASTEARLLIVWSPAIKLTVLGASRIALRFRQRDRMPHAFVPFFPFEGAGFGEFGLSSFEPCAAARFRSNVRDSR